MSRTHARCSALRDRLTDHWGKRDRAGVRKKMRERGIPNGQERIKERRKVGGSMVGQIRLTEQGRRWRMGQTADVCVRACVKKGDKEKEKIKEGFGPVTPLVRLPGIISRHINNSQSRHCSLPGPRSHHSTVTSRVTLQHTSVIWCVVSFLSLFFSFVDRCFLPSNHHVTCQVSPAPTAH